MKVSSESETVRSFSLLKRLAVIAVVMLAVGALAIWAVYQFELCKMWLAFSALAVCVISSLVAHVAGEYPSGDENFAARLALSMAVRTGLPFLAVIVVKASPEIPFESGFVLLVILFYCVGLVVDVSLHSARLKASQ